MSGRVHQFFNQKPNLLNFRGYGYLTLFHYRTLLMPCHIQQYCIFNIKPQFTNIQPLRSFCDIPSTIIHVFQSECSTPPSLSDSAYFTVCRQNFSETRNKKLYAAQPFKEANSPSAGQQSADPLWKTRANFCARKCPAPVLTQLSRN